MFYHPLRYNPKKSVILETDFSLDVDDVGALSLLLGSSRRHGFAISGISVNSPRPESAAAITAILAARGMQQIPIGLADEQSSEESAYHQVLAGFLSAEARAALRPMASAELYRRALEQAADNSLVIISIGFFNVLEQVWRAQPALFERKVETVIAMAGSFLFRPGYREFNIVYAFPEASSDFINNYPGRMIFSGVEMGYEMYTDLSPKAGSGDPVPAAYEAFNVRNNPDGPRWRRASFDPLTVDFAVYGEGARYRLSPNADITVDGGGVIQFRENPAANRCFIVANQDDDTLGRAISEAILQDIP